MHCGDLSRFLRLAYDSHATSWESTLLIFPTVYNYTNIYQANVIQPFAIIVLEPYNIYIIFEFTMCAGYFSSL